MGSRRLSRAAALALGAAAIAAGCGGTESGSAPGGFQPLERGVVAWVNDGDTLTLTSGRKVRLVQIDAPELTGECYGRAAAREARRLMPVGTRVTLQADPALDNRDVHGRLLRYVESKGFNINAELVALGAAVPYFFRGDRGLFADELMVAAREARRTRAGLWGVCPRARLDPRRGALTGPA